MPDFSISSAVGVLPLTGQVSLDQGTTGLGLPPETLSFVDSASGGGRYKTGRYAMRDAVLVLGVECATETELETVLRTIANHVDRESSPALVATYPSGETWRIPFYKTGGGETVRSLSQTYEQWEFDIRCPSPLWVRDGSAQFSVSAGSATVGLLPDLAELPVSASSAYGTFEVENMGDVPAPVNWRITGPGGPVEVSLGGRGFTFITPLEAGEVISIVRGASGWSVTDQTGANRYADLGPAPKFPSAPRGVSTGFASITDAESGASVAGWFNPLRKMVR